MRALLLLVLALGACACGGKVEREDNWAQHLQHAAATVHAQRGDGGK